MVRTQNRARMAFVAPVTAGALVALLVATPACSGGAARSRPPAGIDVATAGPASARAGSAAPTGPAAPGPGADDAPLPLWPKITRGTLANGLTYYVLPHGKPERRAFLWLAVNAGSALEDDDQRGLAHFAEHMAFNGTRRFPRAAIVDTLERLGMRFGADLNARTGFDDTVYELEVPTDDPAAVGQGLDILRDWAGDVSYDPAEVERERGVVLEEWRLGRGAEQRVFDLQAPVSFAGSRYAARDPIGLPDVIRKAPRERLVQFYRDWYRPDLMAVIAVGDFGDAAAVERAITARFGDLRAPASPRPRAAAGVPTAGGTRVSIVADRELASTTVSVENLVPHRPDASARDYRQILVEQLYQAVANERFAAIARAPDAPFVVAGAVIESPVREVDAFVRVAEAKPGQAAAALDRLVTEVARIERHGVTAAELERARAIVLRAAEQSAADEPTTDSRTFTEELTRHYFAGELVVGRAAELALARSILPTVTVADLNALAASFGGDRNRVILVAGPTAAGAALPTEAQVRAVVDDVGRRAIEPWRDAPVPTQLMAARPAPGTIAREARRDAIGVTEWTLGNGARVVIKPTDFEADHVTLLARSPGGTAIAGDAAYRDARFADDLAAIGGVGDLDVELVAKVLAGKAVSAAATISEVTEGVEAAASARDLEAMFQLVHLQLTRPRKDDRAIAVWRKNTADALINERRSPEVQFGLASEAARYRRHPRRLPPEPADIARVRADAALTFYRDRFSDVSDFTFVIVGAVDLAALRPLVETYLASLPGRGRKEPFRDRGVREAPGVVKRTFRYGREPKAYVQLVFHGDEAWTRDKDRDAYVLSEALSIRLRELLREDKGGVYGVSVGGAVSRVPHQARDVTISFGCDPARVDELIRAALDEIARIQREGVPEEIMEKMRQTFSREREVALKTNGFWAGWLSSAYLFGDDPAMILNLQPMLARMTVANVQAAARRFLDPKQYYQAVLLPEP